MYSSPLARALETADAIAAGRRPRAGAPTTACERSTSASSKGLSYEEIRARAARGSSAPGWRRRRPCASPEARRSPTCGPASWRRSWRISERHDGEAAAVVAHGGVVRVVLADALGLADERRLPARPGLRRAQRRRLAGRNARRARDERRPILARMSLRRPPSSSRSATRSSSATSRTRTPPGSRAGSPSSASRCGCWPPSATPWRRSPSSCASRWSGRAWSSSPAGSAGRPTTSPARRSLSAFGVADRGDPGAGRVAAVALRPARASANTPRAGRASRKEPCRWRTRSAARPASFSATSTCCPASRARWRRCSRPWPTGFAGEPIGAWRRRYATGEGQIVAVLEEATRRHPAVTVGSYPSFLDTGPEVEVVLKSADAEALGEAAAWVEAALAERIGRMR